MTTETQTGIIHQAVSPETGNPYENIDRELQQGILQAYEAPTLAQAAEGAALAVAGNMHNHYGNGELARVTYSAATEAVRPVIEAFSSDGRTFEQARHEGHSIADKYLPAALRAVGITDKRISSRITTEPIGLKDMAYVLSDMLGSEVEGIDIERLFAEPKTVRKLLKSVVKGDDRLKGRIGDLYFDESEAKPLSETERDAFGIRLHVGSATWRTAEVVAARRSNARGKNGRRNLDPVLTSKAHDLGDHLIITYRRLMTEGKTPEQAFLGALWEGPVKDGPEAAIFKDRRLASRQKVGAATVAAAQKSQVVE